MVFLITTCAACAKPLAHNAPPCERCKTRYCDRTCYLDHWRRGHKQICKRIHRGGNAEQYNADKKYKEAVAVAVEACADDTQGQTCYICLEAVHARTGEGLVRGCACGDRDSVASGRTGIAHVSCLAQQAKMLREEAEENKLDNEQFSSRWARWHTCGLCEQHYHGVVCCALGWACWKTYVGQPEADMARGYAMTELGTGLHVAKRYDDALTVREAELAMRRRQGASAYDVLVAQGNLASTYATLGRNEEALSMRQEVYSGRLKLNGEEHTEALEAAHNYATSFINLRRFDESKALYHQAIPVARRVLGESHELTLQMRIGYGLALWVGAASLDDLREAVTTLEETERTARRVLGGAHPTTSAIEEPLQHARARLRAYETPSGSA